MNICAFDHRGVNSKKPDTGPGLSLLIVVCGSLAVARLASGIADIVDTMNFMLDTIDKILAFSFGLETSAYTEISVVVTVSCTVDQQAALKLPGVRYRVFW